MRFALCVLPVKYLSNPLSMLRLYSADDLPEIFQLLSS